MKQKNLKKKWEKLTPYVWGDISNDIILILKKNPKKYSMLDGNEIIMNLTIKEYKKLIDEKNKNESKKVIQMKRKCLGKEEVFMSGNSYICKSCRNRKECINIMIELKEKEKE